MTLAARCPSCGTVFRVVQDQLRVSDGWVRCGRCGEVFNAVQNLVDLEVDVAVPRRPAAGEPVAGVGGEPGFAPPPGAAGATPAGDRAADSGFRIEDAAGPAADRSDRTPTPDVGDTRPGEDRDPDADTVRSSDETADRDVASTPASADAGPSAGPAVGGAAAEPPGPATEPASDADAGPTPTFVRHADARARWRQPGVRAALALACVAGALVLAAQAAHEWRDEVAARWPAARPLLEAMCREPCRIAAPRDIEGLSVESSGLVRVEGTSMYQLQVLLRNRSALPLSVPALDLTLSDSRGGTIARRVLLPEDTGVATDALPPAAELPIQATLAVTGRPVAGYTIEIFYP